MPSSTRPSDASTSVRLVLQNFDQLAAGTLGGKFISPTVSLGPVEFRLKAVASKGNSDIRLEPMLARAATARKFPWVGTVDGHVRVMAAKGKKVKYEAEPLKSIEVSRETSTAPYFIPWATSSLSFTTMKDYVEKNALHLELKVVVKISLEGKGGNWRIPMSLLTASDAKDLSESEPDLKVQSRDGKRIPAHRGILAGCSKLLKTELKGNKGVLRLNDMGAKAVKAMIKFASTGGFCKEMEDFKGHDTQVFLELVRAAKKYEMPSLMKLAGAALMLRCTRRNAPQLLQSLKEDSDGEVMKEELAQLSEYVKNDGDDDDDDISGEEDDSDVDEDNEADSWM